MTQKGQAMNTEELEAVLDRHPRAAKLMLKGKPFIVIAEDEPYFLFAYGLIRDNERKAGRWDNDDENAYLDAAERWTLKYDHMHYPRDARPPRC